MDPKEIVEKSIESTLADAEAENARLLADNDRLSFHLLEALIAAEIGIVPEEQQIDGWRTILSYGKLTISKNRTT